MYLHVYPAENMNPPPLSPDALHCEPSAAQLFSTSLPEEPSCIGRESDSEPMTPRSRSEAGAELGAAGSGRSTSAAAAPREAKRLVTSVAAANVERRAWRVFIGMMPAHPASAAPSASAL
jgi:hypothetical protein